METRKYIQRGLWVLFIYHIITYQIPNTYQFLISTDQNAWFHTGRFAMVALFLAFLCFALIGVVALFFAGAFDYFFSKTLDPVILKWVANS